MSEHSHSPTPWEVVEANENHGAYVVNVFGGDVCDLYAMSNPSAWSVVNGGDSRAVPFLDADANARLIVKAVNSHDNLVKALENVRKIIAEGAMTGFNYKDGDWAERLFESQQATSAALASIKGNLP